MSEALGSAAQRHLKAVIVGGGIFAAVGALFGYMAGLTKEGAGAGFVLGWVVGEIFSLAALGDEPQCK